MIGFVQLLGADPKPALMKMVNSYFPLYFTPDPKNKKNSDQEKHKRQYNSVWRAHQIEL